MKECQFVLTLMMAGIIVFSGFAFADKKVDPKVLFENTCSQCHSLEWAKSQRHNKDGWLGIIEKMKYNGLSISGDEEKIIVEYLSKVYGQ